ncbi:MAG: hypothetical protein NAG76_22335 [Candidatus Pristimantibacillus lignocellulolyticus]|uniref:Uncharacterized protein n=1 Tax=Candidatus Pristimantibacillus lignocellulolyticus TaxID=2994561 RepID=A0A9J6ZFG5_9BACL|nr:MAG: hypothetical protein NAG76_22335 [Candidatus Pristimantibacillus lignocellulolyticus]
MGKLSKEELDSIWKTCHLYAFLQSHLPLKLLNHIDTIEAEKDQLIDNVAQLQKELNGMKLSLERATSDANEWEKAYFNLRDNRTPEKVVLPQDVVKAIDNFMKTTSVNYLMYALTTKDSVIIETDRLKVLRGFAHQNGGLLIQALVNGYTVEEEPTTEERIKNKLYEELMLQKILYPIDVNKLAQNLTLAIREILAEDAVKQHDS